MLNPGPGQLFDYSAVSITDAEYKAYKRLVYELAGIALKDKKKPLLTGRLAKRLRYHDIRNYTDYLQLVNDDHQELQMMIDLVSTNETSFFREKSHFDFLERHVRQFRQAGGSFRIWSAACSSGMEAYSAAMVLTEAGTIPQWEILGTDISTRILEKARRALYPLDAAKPVPTAYLKKYCLKGVRKMSGYMLIEKSLRDTVKFKYLNLNDPHWPELGIFDVIFLRNVMIYFDMPTKQRLVNRIVQKLKRGGYLFVGHSENLLGIPTSLAPVQPSIYQKL